MIVKCIRGVIAFVIMMLCCVGVVTSHASDEVENPLEKMAKDTKATLFKQGVHVINIGEDHLLILPAHLVFLGDSPNIAPDAYELLNSVSDYLVMFSKITVTVYGYTDDHSFEGRNIALSRERADNVAMYLWNSEVDARLVLSNGYGSARPIANNATGRGSLQNERVEITFRSLGWNVDARDDG